MKLRRYRCSTCHKRTGLTFSSLMRHYLRHHAATVEQVRR